MYRQPASSSQVPAASVSLSYLANVAFHLTFLLYSEFRAPLKARPTAFYFFCQSVIRANGANIVNVNIPTLRYTVHFCVGLLP
jgi:multisubunit Na+/H+ antiporter MnhB subunit